MIVAITLIFVVLGGLIWAHLEGWEAPDHGEDK